METASSGIDPSYEGSPVRLPAVIVLVLVIAWALIDVWRSYPQEFFPRFWDEAIYMVDVTTPGVLAGRFTGDMHYAAAKPGYGWSLAGAVALLGDRGAMYLSTLWWLLTIGVIGLAVLRRFGGIAGLIAAALLAYSPLFGKYVAEAGPTTMAACFFSLLWISYDRRRWLAAGLAIGCLALIDFKWIPPVVVAVVLIEVLLEHNRPWRHRVAFAGRVALVAASIPALLILVHRPFGDYLWSYLFVHGQIMGLHVSPVLLYFLLRFGMGLAIVAAAVSLLLAPVRERLGNLGESRVRSLLVALVLAIVPIAFYSVFGPLKALRFFAVPFPLVAIPVAVVISRAFAWSRERLRSSRPVARWTMASVLAAMLSIPILVASDGPARHLRIPTCYPQALTRLAEIAPEGGVISSYIWPVPFYGRRGTLKSYPFTFWGVKPGVKWLASDRVLDVVTVENRQHLGSAASASPESFLAGQRGSFLPYLDSLLSVPSDFYASDYFLAEQVVGGIGTMRRWEALSRDRQNVLTIYRINPGLWQQPGQ
ncbi:MAG: hypothetical protein HZB43_00100 [candidate division Zixibacteria bacterium]|nr:hypothetical protein [candidate division Zixibacteria bacterium]